MAAAWTQRSPLGHPAADRPVLMLAPMEGISDDIMRELLSGLGGMDLCVTEFIRVTRAPLKPEVLLRECPELAAGGRTRGGTPVLVQLLGGEPGPMAESARVAVELGALGVDLNFGCPARKVNGSDGGAALLRTPHRLTEVVGAVRQACPRDITVSAKIRLGWEDPDDVLANARAVEAGGADWITIHGRTRAQQYRPSADWTRIGAAVREVRIPVVANGDLFSPTDLLRCAAVTGARAFMLGRGAFRTPNLFRWARGLDPGPMSPRELVALVARFVERVLAHPRYDQPGRAAVNRVKGWVRAMSEASPEMASAFERLKRSHALAEVLATLSAAGSAHLDEGAAQRGAPWLEPPAPQPDPWARKAEPSPGAGP